jgi:GTP-binding protein LepA
MAHIHNSIRIRNFAIIAHIDHGKSTLADRLMEFCGAVSSREMQQQMLDTLEVERQRGITVKSQTVRLQYKDYILNLIDTPGHVDFSFEVRRALAACEGAIVLVDATQGVEAQTIANVYKALEEDVFLLPVLNKIDLPSAQIDEVTEQIHNILGIPQSPILISAKTGIGIEELIHGIIQHIPNPTSTSDEFQALLIDAWFDEYLGIVLLIRVKNGLIKQNQSFKFMSNNIAHKAEKLYFLTPKLASTEIISAGEVGIIIANIRTIKDCIIGDTLTSLTSTVAPIKTFKPQKPAVFCGLFPIDASLYSELRYALEKLSLNDASLTITNTSSPALGAGFHCGFLGLLHLEVTTQRLEQEFNVSVMVTSPSVEYIVTQTNNQIIKIHDASEMPQTQKTKLIEEPWVCVSIFSQEQYLGDIIELCINRRAINQNIRYVNKIGNAQNIICTYEMPLGEIIFDFHDKLKSLSQGYASFDYEEIGVKESDVVVVNILVNGTPVDALSTIVHRTTAASHGRWICEQLKNEIPRQLFAVAIQASIDSKIIARETVSALRKDVTAKCYGGDISRKRKLLDKQKEGKKRMKTFGNVDIPSNAILNVLKKTK